MNLNVTFLIKFIVAFTFSFVTAGSITLAQDDNDNSPPSLDEEPLDSASNPGVDNPYLEWEKRQNADERLTVFGDDLMGDGIDPHTGSISFEHTDVSLPGNSSLPVAVSRRRKQGMVYSRDTDVEFGDWELLVPRIYVITTSLKKWTGDRCSNSFDVQFPNQTWGRILDGDDRPQQGITTPNYEYSEGVFLDVPGAGIQTILETPNGAHWPEEATHVTSDNWYLFCDTEKASDEGQGFVAKSPDGDTYRFDRVITHDAPKIFTPGGTNHLNRTRNILAATQVMDVHGNTVNYTYDLSGRLTEISGDDGRLITLGYSGTSKLIDTVTANKRVWTYKYRDIDYSDDEWGLIPFRKYTNQVLDEVVLPDDRSWKFTLDDMVERPLLPKACGGQDVSISVEHPSGAIGDFELSKQYHRYAVEAFVATFDTCVPPREPDADSGGLGSSPPPVVTRNTTPVMSVTKKTISGPNILDSEWVYEYENDESDSIPAAGERHNETIVTGPGVTIKYYHNWITEPFGGKVMKKEVSVDGTILETTETDYVIENALGISFTNTYRNAGDSVTPIRVANTKITRDSDWWETQNSYDTNQESVNYSYGNPIQTSVRSNVSTARRITDFVYEHNLTEWIIGLTKSVMLNDTELSSYTYDDYGQIESEDRYGVHFADYHYDSTDSPGMLSSITDALNRTTSFHSYKRGKPQSIRRADSSQVSQVVDDNGWVTSSTDARFNKTVFKHDPMGRLTLVNPPGSFWAETSINYEFSDQGAVQTITKGQAVETITYDNYHRPILEQSKEKATGWSSYVSKKYDGLGRVIFQSRPSSSSSPTSGTNYTYDGLGRILTETDTTSEAIKTTHIYHPQHLHVVIGPEGNQTYRYSLGYGGPDSKQYSSIHKKNGRHTQQATHLKWNDLDQLVSIKQTDKTVYSNSFIQNYYYDTQARLCSTYTPEHGETRYEYNAAGEIIAYAKGQSHSKGCGTVPSTNARVDLTYDALGRPLNTTFQDPNTPNITRTYWPNSDNLETVNRGGVNWTYSYHAEADLLRHERIDIDGKVYFSAYQYDSSGAIKQERLPSGRRIDYVSDGLGRITSVKRGSSTIVSGVTYHSNGAVKSMNYGNGQAFTQTLNNRQLPARMHSVDGLHTAIDQIYGYDNRGLITSITDNATDIGNVTENNNRFYGYDGLGRLTSASGPWGTGVNTYDGLNNLRLKTLGTRSVELFYDSNNRLTQSVDSGDSGTRNFSYDARGNVTAINAEETGIVTRRLYFAPATSWVHTAKFSDSGNKVISIESKATAGNLIPEETTAYFEAMSPGDTFSRYMHVYIPGSKVNAVVEVKAEFSGNYVLNISHNATFTGGSPSPFKSHNTQPNDVNTPNHWVNVDNAEADLSFVYDYSNQPTTIGGKAEGSYVYDGNLKRVKAVVGGETIYNFYNLQGRLVLVDNITTGEKTDYISGPMGPLALTKNGEFTYLHPDHLGSAHSGTDTQGRVIWREKYTPFGEEINSPAANDNLAGFTGHIRDKASGLNYMQARYYDPVIGRFLSIDPMTFLDTGDPRYFNRYAYTANDPVNLIDPTGEAFGVASKVIKVAIKGGDVGAVLAGGIADAKTLTGRNVSLGRRLAAGASLATEIFSPVSARDAKAITNGASQLLKAEKIQGPPKVDIGLTNGRRTGGTPQTRLKVTEASGNTKDITRERVKAKSPNTHPSAPSGAMSNTKFDNPQPGSGGLKRDPTPDEVRMIDNVER